MDKERTPETYRWYLKIPAAHVTPYVEQLLLALYHMEERAVTAEAHRDAAKDEAYELNLRIGRIIRNGP